MNFIENLQLKKEVPRRYVQERTVICLHIYHGFILKMQTSCNREAQCIQKNL